ncbi:MAG: hypothetical protein ACRCX2_38580 [Paraclostridium sp.]
MRKITEQMLSAVNEKRNFKLSNTEVENDNYSINVYLHGNGIFKGYFETNKKVYSSCGRYSNTTKERLNAVMPEGFAIAQRAYDWYIINNEGLYIKWFDGITASQIENGEYKPLKEL